MRWNHLLLLGPVLSLIACSSPPVDIKVFESPDGEITIQPGLKNRVGVPNNRPMQSSLTADGHRLVVFHLQNQTSSSFSLHVQATFYDAAGIPVDVQSPQTVFLRGSEIQVVQAISSSNQAKRTLIQVRKP